MWKTKNTFMLLFVVFFLLYMTLLADKLYGPQLSWPLFLITSAISLVFCLYNLMIWLIVNMSLKQLKAENSIDCAIQLDGRSNEIRGVSINNITYRIDNFDGQYAVEVYRKLPFLDIYVISFHIPPSGFIVVDFRFFTNISYRLQVFTMN